eukprot:2166785-Amphidinium_carterae.1
MTAVTPLPDTCARVHAVAANYGTDNEPQSIIMSKLCIKGNAHESLARDQNLRQDHRVGEDKLLNLPATTFT